jgi:1-acyl-sn-glycerol-3-phosphate acyltransferase
VVTPYRAVRLVVRPTMQVVYRLEVAGAEHVPASGGVVVVANHLSALDPFVLGSAVPRDLCFMAKAELWRVRLVGRLVEALGGFPVDRGRGDRDAVARAVELTRSGRAVALFPQGRVRSEGVWHRGAARVALRTGAPIVPVRLFDTDRALAGRRLGLSRLRVAIGEPIPVEPESPTVAVARALTARVREAVEALPDPVA